MFVAQIENNTEGAVDFIQKPFRDQALIDCVHKALALDTKNRAQLQQQDVITKNLHTLAQRERQVMDMIMNRKPNKVIAADPCLSQRTVEVHHARAMEKMKATSVAHLVRMVMQVQ